MSKSVQPIVLKEGCQLLVEVEEVELSPDLTMGELAPYLPPGTEEICFGKGERFQKIADLLRQNLTGVFETVAEAVKEKQPDEWGVEVSIGFKGKSNPIPVILSGEANAAIKVHAKWTKDKSEEQETVQDG